MYAFENKTEKLLTEHKIAGSTVFVTDFEKVIYSKAYGTLSTKTGKFTEVTSLYRVASITKIVTGVLAMRAKEAGMLDLDRPVKQYLPWLELRDKEAAAVITPRMLLSHTSGLPGEYTPDGPRDEAMLIPSLKSGLPELDLVSMPGEGKYLYSNWGIRLLSAVLESVLGDRYSALAARYVLNPCGMTDSSFFREKLPECSLSMPHTRDENGDPIAEGDIKENYVRLATGGLYSSAPDLAKLARMMMRKGIADSGERILNEESVSEMESAHATLKSGDTYGLTLQLHNLPSAMQCIGHYGNADPYSSAMFWTSDRRYCAIVLLNTMKEGIRREICDMMLDEIWH